MIDVANKYEQELKVLYYETWINDKYKFLQIGGYNSGFQAPSNDNWKQADFVSLDSENNIIGHISYEINRQHRIITGLTAINFTDNKAVFGRDLITIISNLFKSNIKKIVFNVVVGNPVEKSYDKYVSKYGGRVVGYFEDDTILNDGLYYNVKTYEVMNKNYVKT